MFQLSPKVFLLLATLEEEPRTVLTHLEKFLAVHLGMGLICLALGLVIGVSS